MGFKPWRHLGLLIFAGAALVGCTATNPPNKQGFIDSKGPPINSQANQKSTGLPNSFNASQQQSPFAQQGQTPNPGFGNQQVPLVPTTGTNLPNQGMPGPIPPWPTNAPIVPPTNSFPPAPGTLPPSTTFGPDGKMPTFPPLNQQPNGAVQLPGSNYSGTITNNSALFNPPNVNLPVAPQSGGFPSK